MNEPWTHWLTAVGLSVFVSSIAYFKRWLTLPGAIAAAVVGSSVYGAGGWQGALPLLLFFFSSTLIPRLFGKREKSERRESGQVLANGGVAAICAWLSLLDPERATLWWTGAVASLAEAAGDTWATEFGTRLGKNPRLITNWQAAPAGSSGAVSGAGFAANLVGVLFIVSFSALPLGLTLWQAFAATVGALTGGLLDSLLGATLQARFRCSVCGKVVESQTHCETRATPAQGCRYLQNSEVNFLCSAASGLIACGLIWWG